jgi:hypothetical protein
MPDENGNEGADFHLLGEAANRELMKRFESDPASVPGSFLMKFVLDYDKRRDSRAYEAEAAPEYDSVRTILNDMDIDPERKKELLLLEKERLEEELGLVNIELEEL